MYVTDAVQDRNDIEMLRENMVKSKGRNNFKICFSMPRRGKPTALKLSRSVKWQRRTIF
ncbi:hypothetical protein I6K84_27490 [Escherichia coli]|nr:hypothetical protein [Escherichia coli]